MTRKVLLLSFIISMGIFSWVQQLPPAQKIKARVDRGQPELWQPAEKNQKPLVLAAAMKGPLEPRTPDYTVTPKDRIDKSPPPVESPSTSNEKKEKKEDEKKETPKPAPAPDRPR